jgi:hypothetical protein
MTKREHTPSAPALVVDDNVYATRAAGMPGSTAPPNLVKSGGTDLDCEG